MSGPSHYKPPFSLSDSAVNRIASICELLGAQRVLSTAAKDLRLRGVNQIRTIQGSLAIEGNTLTTTQVTAILEGKPVVAPPREVQEVKNALVAYDRFEDWDPGSESDLLSAHQVLMGGLIDEVGQYRSGGVGVVSGSDVVHMAPSAGQIPGLMRDLISWLAGSEQHPLVSSSVFHYEFEFIHPFQDGNGRMGRLWQSLILAKWNPLFSQIPVESLIHEHQSEYYQAIQVSTNQADCGPFVDFMLRMINEALVSTPQATPKATPQAEKLLEVLTGEMSAAEIQGALGLKDSKSFRKRYLRPALDAGLIEMTHSESPRSPLQKYRATLGL